MKDDNGDLDFKGIMKDKNFIDLSERQSYGTIYNNLAHGDSGGPIMRKIDIEVNNKKTEKRNVIVAIISIGVLPTIITDKINTKCLTEGTKVTQEMIQWIKKLDSGDYSLGKNIKSVKLNIRPTGTMSEQIIYFVLFV